MEDLWLFRTEGVVQGFARSVVEAVGADVARSIIGRIHFLRSQRTREISPSLLTDGTPITLQFVQECSASLAPLLRLKDGRLEWAEAVPTADAVALDAYIDSLPMRVKTHYLDKENRAKR
ncbi:MAG TPA: hypothetical protein VGM39_01315 [Kofleriaceae bacterium]